MLLLMKCSDSAWPVEERGNVSYNWDELDGVLLSSPGVCAL